MNPIEENELINRSLKNDPKAQRVLFEWYVQEIFILCIRYVPDEFKVEEIVSETFYKAFKSLKTFTNLGVGSFRAWLSKIAVNECLMFLRKKEPFIFPLDDLQFVLESSTDNVFEKLKAEDLLNLIQGLPVGYRTVFNLFVIEGYSHAEIAEVLNISESTSKTQLMKSKQFLRKKIKHHERII